MGLLEFEFQFGCVALFLHLAVFILPLRIDTYRSIRRVDVYIHNDGSTQ